MGSDIKRYQDNLRDELNGAALYAALAAAESDPLRKDLFMQLARAESSHAQLWRDKLSAAGIRDERFVPGFRTRLLAKLAQRFGPRFVLPTIAAAEFADRNKYAGQTDAIEQTPLAEQHELALIFQAKGMPKEDARRVASQMMKDKKGALDTLAREELGICSMHLPN